MHQQRVKVMVDLVDSIKYFLRRFKSRIAYAEIIDIFFAEDLSHFLAFLEHSPDL